MQSLGRGLGGMALLLAGAAATGGVPVVRAQVAYPAGPGGGVPFVVPVLPVVPGQPGVAPAGTAANPLHVTGGGGSGGGGGDASSANQQAQLAQETAAAGALGAPGDAAWGGGPGSPGSVVAVLKRVAGLLGTPLQVAGTSGAPADASAAVGTASVQLLPTVGARQFLLVQNQSGTATVGVNFGAAAALAPGSVLLQPGGTLLLQVPGFVPNAAVTAVASAAGTPLTVKAY